MDKIIEMTRALGRAIQQDERCQRYMTAQEANDSDSTLQELIATFEIKRNALSTEVQKDDKNTEKIKELDSEVKSIYRQIFENENMIAFTEAREEMQAMIGFVNQIITGSSNGQNPDTIQQAAACGGSCSSCAGCA